MGLPVVIVAAGGLPVTDRTTVASGGLPMTVAANGYGVAVTLVAEGGGGISAVFVPPLTPPAEAPTNIAWAGTHTVAEDAPLGTAIGGALSFTDPDSASGTFSLVDDAGGLFTIGGDGTSIIVDGVLDYETATTHNITVRFTDDTALTYDEVFTITVTDVVETLPGFAGSAMLGGGLFPVTITGDTGVRQANLGGVMVDTSEG